MTHNHEKDNTKVITLPVIPKDNYPDISIKRNDDRERDRPDACIHDALELIRDSNLVDLLAGESLGVMNKT